MLVDDDPRLIIPESDFDIYERVLPAESPLLDALELIPWDSFESTLNPYYCSDMGQPARLPLMMLKLEFLRYFYLIGDRKVIDRAQTDLLFRWFLQVPIRYRLPDPSTLTRFRARLGAEGYGRLLNRLVTHAREIGVVRDRLRLKDATHVVAKIAVPTTLKLLAQLREKLLAAIKKIDPEAAEGYRIQAEGIRSDSENAEDEIKISQRLELIIDILGWVEEQTPPKDKRQESAWEKLQAVYELATKIVGDTLAPGQGDRTLSVVDPDARRGKHGDFFDGYLVDVLMDADSELITQVEVLPANGAEAMDTVQLVAKEQQAHGNQIEQVSIDGVGFHGPTLRALEDDLAVSVITPVRGFERTAGFHAREFELTEDGQRVICPAGHVSQKGRRRQGKERATQYDFCGNFCSACPLLSACRPDMKPGSRVGRRVIRNDYEVEYQRAREKAQTETYRSVRREHPAVERKLNEVVGHHGGRRANYWGQAKVLAQELMTSFTVNVKRITKLKKAASCALSLQTA